jgi:large subunit ribosomal protein L22
MGARKHNSAELLKEAKKSISYAKLNNCPTSPRKMRLVADLIKGRGVEQALSILKFSDKDASERMRKLLLSAIANWQAKNDGERMEEAQLYIREVSVDGGRMVRRIRPAPQGRAYRIRKRSNHVTMILDSRKVADVTENTSAE